LPFEGGVRAEKKRWVLVGDGKTEGGLVYDRKSPLRIVFKQKCKGPRPNRCTESAGAAGGQECPGRMGWGVTPNLSDAGVEGRGIKSNWVNGKQPRARNAPIIDRAVKYNG